MKSVSICFSWNSFGSLTNSVAINHNIGVINGRKILKKFSSIYFALFLCFFAPGKLPKNDNLYRQKYHTMKLQIMKDFIILYQGFKKGHLIYIYTWSGNSFSSFPVVFAKKIMNYIILDLEATCWQKKAGRKAWSQTNNAVPRRSNDECMARWRWEFLSCRMLWKMDLGPAPLESEGNA